jgi:hypothetical protein
VTADLHTRLLAAVSQHGGPLGVGTALRAVVELHKPVPYWEHKPDEWLVCKGCDLSGYDAENPPWPCSTIQAIAEALGIHNLDRRSE